MEFSKDSLNEFVSQNNVRFIRLMFTDIFGVQKNISVMPGRLEKAFEEGVAFDASAIKGFLGTGESDLYLKPVPRTFSVVPWRSSSDMVIRMISDIAKFDGSDYEGNSRLILQKVKDIALGMGCSCSVGAKCEFYLFENDEAGKPTARPIDEAGYFDVSPLDKGENIRREICLTLEKMGIMPEASYHEQGPGQNEIDFRHDDILDTADNFMTFKWVVSTVASRSGMSADFSPKPIAGKEGNGLHINISLIKDGESIFKLKDGMLQKTAASFIAGIMEKLPEMTLFLNPQKKSYERLGNFDAPEKITWSYRNRSHLIRIVSKEKDFSRMELRSPDPSCNPYIAFALVLAAGLEGIKNGTKLCEPCDELSDTSRFSVLPKTIKEAAELAENSDFIKRYLPPKVLARYLEVKKREF